MTPKGCPKNVDEGLARYCTMKGIDTYQAQLLMSAPLDGAGSGTFTKWYRDHQYTTHQMEIELSKDINNTELLDFISTHNSLFFYFNDIDTFNIIKKCWNDPNAFKIELLIHENKPINKFIFTEITTQRIFIFNQWFKEQIKYNSHLNIPQDIINLCKSFYNIDLVKSYPGKQEKISRHERHRRKNRYKGIARLWTLANKLSIKTEHFIAFSILQLLLNADVYQGYDDGLQMENNLYFGRAIVLRRWNCLEASMKDILMAIYRDGANSEFVYEYGKILHEHKV